LTSSSDPQTGPRNVLKLWSNLGSSLDTFRDVQNVSPNTPSRTPQTGVSGGVLPTPSQPTPNQVDPDTPTGVSGGGGWGVQFEVRRTGRSGHPVGEHVLRARGQAWSSLMSRHQRREHQKQQSSYSTNFGRKLALHNCVLVSSRTTHPASALCQSSGLGCSSPDL
jgi:hypothetical protein